LTGTTPDDAFAAADAAAVATLDDTGTYASERVLIAGAGAGRPPKLATIAQTASAPTSAINPTSTLAFVALKLPMLPSPPKWLQLWSAAACPAPAAAGAGAVARAGSAGAAETRDDVCQPLRRSDSGRGAS